MRGWWPTVLGTVILTGWFVAFLWMILVIVHTAAQHTVLLPPCPVEAVTC